MENIYLDHAATTPLSPKAFEAMKPYFSDTFGNANSQHVFGREAAKGVNDARQLLANCIGAKPSEIYFTSCGTEADNWAVKGIALQNIEKGKHIITSVIEHPANNLKSSVGRSRIFPSTMRVLCPLTTLKRQFVLTPCS